MSANDKQGSAAIDGAPSLVDLKSTCDTTTTGKTFKEDCMADHGDTPKGPEDDPYPWDPEWIWPELGPDDYTFAEQNEQRWGLIEDLKQKEMLDPKLTAILQRPEAVEGVGSPEMGWLRLVVRRYIEGDFNLLDVVEEIYERVNKEPLHREDSE